jgi:2-polyprenyl-6-methoxyphenol hydroxylase-like FAD-dependent oxidoreductase
LAIELARYRVPIRLIDKAAARTDKSEAHVLWSRTLELLARSGAASAIVDAGFKAEAVNIILWMRDPNVMQISLVWRTQYPRSPEPDVRTGPSTSQQRTRLHH